MVRVSIAVDRPDSHAFCQRSLTEHEVPTLAGPKVRRGQGDHGRRVVRQPRGQHLVENVRGEQLLHAPRWMLAAGGGRDGRLWARVLYNKPGIEENT